MSSREDVGFSSGDKSLRECGLSEADICMLFRLQYCLFIRAVSIWFAVFNTVCEVEAPVAGLHYTSETTRLIQPSFMNKVEEKSSIFPSFYGEKKMSAKVWECNLINSTSINSSDRSVLFVWPRTQKQILSCSN